MNIKKLFLSVLIFFISVSTQSFAQKEEDLNSFPEIILPAEGFIGPTLDVVELNNHYFFCPGISVGVIIKEKYLFGFYENFVLNHTQVVSKESIFYNVKYEYGGLLIGYIFKPIRNLRFGLSSKIGKADIVLEDDSFQKYRNKDVMMFTPQADLYYSINSWLRISLNSGFRMTTDLRLDPISKNYFNGPNTSIGILFIAK